MNKYGYIALAVFGTLGVSIAAQAQPAVTVFGVVDTAWNHVSASGAGSLNRILEGGNSNSRFGFRGQEDLGAGLKAGFWLENGFNPDTGTSGATSTNNIDSATNALFGRRATVSLMGGWGELRLGRDFVPSFTNLGNSMHPFGTNGVGGSGFLHYPVNAGGTTPRTHIRASNGLNYFLPGELGGFVGHLAYALGEQNSTPSTTKNDGKYVGGRVGYAAGPFAIAVATGTTQYSTGDFKQTNLGVTFRVGPAKLMLLAGENKVGVTKTSVVTLGTQFTVGNGEIRAAYTQLDAKGVASDAHQIALGYVHDLSKRTALYATASQIDNKGAGKTFNLGVSPVTAGGNSTGYEIGLRHNF
jgi:predicted porin